MVNITILVIVTLYNCEYINKIHLYPENNYTHHNICIFMNIVCLPPQTPFYRYAKKTVLLTNIINPFLFLLIKIESEVYLLKVT